MVTVLSFLARSVSVDRSSSTSISTNSPSFSSVRVERRVSRGGGGDRHAERKDEGLLWLCS